MSLNTRSAGADATTRERIRDVAVVRFARSGFGASVRTIAADAGVSPALVIHHFGSKEGLRSACDEHVLTWIVETKRENMQQAASGRLLEVLARTDEFAPLVGYVLRSLQAGGSFGHAFVEQMIHDAEKYTSEAVEGGIVRPSRDEAARVRFLVLAQLGALLLSVTLDPPDDPEDVSATVRTFMADHYLPTLEVYTEGVLTSRRILDDYLRYVGDQSPPGQGEAADDSAPDDRDPADDGGRP